MKELSIIIPAYNEEARIGKTLDSYYNFFSKKLKNNFEIIVVPNNCKDRTQEIVEKFVREHKNVLCRNINYYVGKGGAVIGGFKLAKGKLIGFVDADNSTKAEACYELYKNIDDYDCIVASRWIKGAKVRPEQPLIRRIASRIFNIIVRILFRINIRDTQCGCKLFKREALMKIIPSLSTTRWAFDVDLLYQLKRNGFKAKEIPTEWHDRPGSKLNVKKASIEMFLAVSRLRLIYSPFKFIVKWYDKLVMGFNK